MFAQHAISFGSAPNSSDFGPAFFPFYSEVLSAWTSSQNQRWLIIDCPQLLEAVSQCQCGLEWSLPRKSFLRSGTKIYLEVLKPGSQSSQILWIWGKCDLRYQGKQTDSTRYDDHFLDYITAQMAPHSTSVSRLPLNIYSRAPFSNGMWLHLQMTTESFVLESIIHVFPSFFYSPAFGETGGK